MNGNEFTDNDPFTEKIIGLAIRVHAELGSGFLEAVYQNSLIFELEDAGIPLEVGAPMEVFYKGRSAGNFVADIIVQGKLLLELKAVDCILKVHEVQVVNYLKATGLNVGLIINFGAPTPQVKRKHRERSNLSSGLRLQEI
jgi:GxxExxY protein